MIQDLISDIIAYVKNKADYLELNNKLFNVYEGDLLTYVLNDLRNQLSPDSYDQIKNRVPPINILKRIIDKLSRIYQQGVVRTVENGNDNDNLLLEWYEDVFKVNQKLNIANEFFNLFKTSAVEPFLNDGVPSLRVVSSDRFLPFSINNIDPTTPTHFITFAGTIVDDMGKTVPIIHIYSDSEFYIVDLNGKIYWNEMAEMGNENGVNPYGKMPFVYINRSFNMLTPIQDSDTFIMAKLFSVMLSDINYAVMYQAFSIIYGINLSDENIKMAPNVFWSLKSDADTDQKQEIGVIKPQVDISETLNLIQSQLAFWLNSRGLRTGSIGDLTPNNFASGISKMVDELDTTEERKKQVEFFTNAEEQFWDLLFNYIHPYWVKTGQIENRTLFSPKAKIKIKFPEQIPMISKADVVKELKDQIEAGFISKRRAISELNPRMSEAEIDDLITEIENEKQIVITNGDNNNGIDLAASTVKNT